MIKLKNILSEAYAWERQEGKSLPTLAEVQAAYDAKMQEQSEDDGHEYEEPPIDDDEYDYMDEAAKPDFLDLDGDGNETESMKSAAADSTPHGNYINKSRAKSHLTKKDGIVHGIDGSGKGHKITNASDLDKYSKFTIKSIDEYGGQDSSLINADMPKNANSDVREKEQMAESFKKRMLGNLHGHEYILREAFKRK
jgi:hypothetical protein